MTKEPMDDIPEIHVNRDKDRYFTMLLLKIHESTDKVFSNPSGANCFSSPANGQQSDSFVTSYVHQASGDRILHSSDSLCNNSDQPKHSKYYDTNVEGLLDYSLPGDACINRKTFAYQPANGCYSKNKKSVQIQRKRHTNRKAFNKTIEEIDDEQNLQLLLEFRQYLFQLVPSEKLDSAEDVSSHDKRLKQTEVDRSKLPAVPKSLSAIAFGAHQQMKHGLPSVQTKPCNAIQNRPSSFHSVLATSGFSKPKKDCFEQDMHCNVLDDVWSLQDENHDRAKRTAGKIDRIKSHADNEIMQKIKYMHQTLTHTGVLPNLGTATALGQMSDTNCFVAGNTDLKPRQLTASDGKNSNAWLNSKTSDSQVAFASEYDRFYGSTAFPLRRNPNAYKPRAPHHVVALATGSCLAHQATTSKPSLHDFEILAQSMNPVVKSGSQLSYPSTVDNRSNAEANSGILPLQGKKIQTRRAKHRIL